MRNKVMFTTLLALMALSLMVPAASASTTVRVDGDHQSNWVFNRDPGNRTPYEFTTLEESTGAGSIFIAPIGANASDKFIAEHFLSIPTSDLASISYDFQIAGPAGDIGDADDFYLNVYTNLPGSSTYYDCRFDYTPSTGSLTEFTTASFATTDTPTRVVSRGGATCPATLAEMLDGSTVSFFSLNVGQSSASDVGLAGFLDNVVVETTSGTVAYDFEAAAENAQECKGGGHLEFGYSNQGLCVSSVNANGNSGK